MPHDTKPLSNAQTRDIEALLHPYTNPANHRRVGAHLIERGEGIYVYDESGHRFIEGMAGLWCAGLGFGDAELIDAAKAQLDRLPYYHLFGGRTHEPAIELAEKIKDLYPVPMARVFYGSSGSEANDTQVKLIWYMNNGLGRSNKKKIIARKKGYHGITLVAASLTGLPLNHNSFDVPFEFAKHTTTPHYWREGRDGETEEQFTERLAQDLEELILKDGPDTVAAFIAEPVMGAGGVIVPPKTYFEKIQAVLKKYDVLFIADEVICGFGRTGKMFGTETFKLQPDIISVAKQLSSAYLPIAGLLMSEAFYQVLADQSEKLGTLGMGYTYAGHPVAAAVALETLRIYESDGIVDHVRAVSPRFMERLKALERHPLVGEARGIGLIGAVEIVRDKGTKEQFDQQLKANAQIVAKAQAHGLLVRPLPGDVIGICPPLIITEPEIDLLFDRLQAGLDDALPAMPMAA